MKITRFQDTPQYERQKELYESVPITMRRKLKAEFDELFDLFADRCVKFVDIARSYGTSKQAVTIIYQKYFEELFHVDGFERRIFCTLSGRRKLIEHLRSIPPERGSLLSVWRAAEKEGLKVLRVPTNTTFRYWGAPSMFDKKLEIGGVPCAIRTSKTRKPYGGTRVRYYHVQVGDISGYPIIIVSGVRETFIIPTSGLEGKNFIYIRTTDVAEPYNNIRPKVDWRQYKDRWDLIKKEAKSGTNLR